MKFSEYMFATSAIYLLLSDDQIAELKSRINRSCKIGLAKPNGCIVERSHSSGRSTDTRLLGQ